MARRGPVPRGEYVNKSRVLSTRIKEDTRAALEDAAAESGRSLSQEIEHRLRKSFDDDLRISDRFGSRENYAVIRLLVSLFEKAPNGSKSWLDDPDNFNHVLASITSVLNALRPPGAPEEPTETDLFLADINSARLADDMAAADAMVPPDDPNPMNHIKSDLGPRRADRLKKLEGSGIGASERAWKRRQK